MKTWKSSGLLLLTAAILAGSAGCRNQMPHAFTWPAGGDIQYTHAKPPEGGYYSNWDPYAVELRVTPIEDVNPVRTQHVLIAEVLDEDGERLPNRRVEWIIADGSVGDIVEVDESGWRASRGYKVANDYAVSHTNNFEHVLDMGNDDPSDDITLLPGQTWCVITSPIEGDTHMTVYAPGIYDWSKHKVFVTKHWYDVQWSFPPPATNPIGTMHQFTTEVSQYSDGAPLPNYEVTYRIVDGPGATFEQSGGQVATVRTDGGGLATVTLRQTTPMEGTNNIEIDIMRPANEACCEPPVHIATGMTSKTWIGPEIAITKTAQPKALVGEQFPYNITVTNPSQVNAENTVVTDTLPDGIEYVSSSPSANVTGQTLTWQIGTLAAGSSRDISVQVRGTRTGTFDNCADVTAAYNLSDRDCAQTVITAPQLAIDKTCTQSVSTCDAITYNVTVRNTGDGPAQNVVVTDQLPDGLTLESGGMTMTENIGTLGAGESRQLTYTARASRVGSFTNTVRVTGDGGLGDEASCTTEVRDPVLEVTKTGPEMRYLNRDATFDITVRNTGNAPANSTTLTDNLPAGTQFVSASDGGSASGNTVTWSLGTLEAGGSRTVSVTVRAVTAGTVRNVVTARATCTEDSAEVTMRIQGVPAILLEVVDVDDPIEVGANETYVITVTNQGTADDTNIVIEAVVAPEQEFVSADGPTQAIQQGNTITFQPLPVLGPKQKATYRVIVRGTSEADARFKITLTSDVITSPVQETESTHIYR